MARVNRRRLAWFAAAIAVFAAWRFLRRDDAASPVARDVPSPARSVPPTAWSAGSARRRTPAADAASESPLRSEDDDQDFAVEILRSDRTRAAGAELRVVRWIDDVQQTFAATADANGMARMRLPKGTYTIVAWCGTEAAEDECWVGAGWQDWTVALRPAPVARGLVTLDDRPVAGATVKVKLSPGHIAWVGPPFRALGFETTTDAEGRFASPPIANREARETVIDVQSAERAIGSARASMDSLRRGDEVRIALRRTVRVRGRLLDADGKPRCGALVRSASYNDDSVHVDDAGRFELLAHDDAPAVIALWDCGGENLPGANFSGRLLGPMPRTGGDIDLGDVVLAAGVPVRGVIVDARGRVAPNVRLWLHLGGACILQTENGADGRFVLPCVGPDPHRLHAFECRGDIPDAPLRDATIEDVKGGIGELRIVLADVFVIRATIDAESEQASAAPSCSIRTRPHDSGTDWIEAKVPAEQSHGVRVDLPRAGSYDVKVDATGFESQVFEAIEVVAEREMTIEVHLRRKP